MDTQDAPKTLKSAEITTEDGQIKLTPWFEDDMDLFEYVEGYSGTYNRMFERCGSDMYQLIAGEKLPL